MNVSSLLFLYVADCARTPSQLLISRKLKGNTPLIFRCNDLTFHRSKLLPTSWSKVERLIGKSKTKRQLKFDFFFWSLQITIRALYLRAISGKADGLNLASQERSIHLHGSTPHNYPSSCKTSITLNNTHVRTTIIYALMLLGQRSKIRCRFSLSGAVFAIYDL